jgi:hypothetical protein
MVVRIHQGQLNLAKTGQGYWTSLAPLKTPTLLRFHLVDNRLDLDRR